jgi:hypothetical protein
MRCRDRWLSTARKSRVSAGAQISAAVEGNARRPRFGQCLEERPWRDAKVRLPARFARVPKWTVGPRPTVGWEKILPARCACRFGGYRQDVSQTLIWRNTDEDRRAYARDGLIPDELLDRADLDLESVAAWLRVPENELRLALRERNLRRMGRVGGGAGRRLPRRARQRR